MHDNQIYGVGQSKEWGPTFTKLNSEFTLFSRQISPGNHCGTADISRN